MADEGVDDVGIVVQLLVDHEGKDAHLGGTAVVELDGELLGNGLVVPSGGLELGGFNVLLAGSKSTFDDSNGQKGAEDGLNGEISESLEASADLGEVVAGGQGGGEAVASGGHKVAKDGKLGNAAVLGLDGAEAVELGLISLGEESKRIPEAKRRLGTNLTLEAHLEARGASDAGNGGEGSNAEDSDKEKDNAEHFKGVFRFSYV